MRVATLQSYTFFVKKNNFLHYILNKNYKNVAKHYLTAMCIGKKKMLDKRSDYGQRPLWPVYLINSTEPTFFCGSLGCTFVA